MFNYRLTNTKGETLGVVSLETDDVAELLSAGEIFSLSCVMRTASLDCIDFVIAPEPVEARSD